MVCSDAFPHDERRASGRAGRGGVPVSAGAWRDNPGSWANETGFSVLLGGAMVAEALAACRGGQGFSWGRIYWA
jgi:hypothetical protein